MSKKLMAICLLTTFISTLAISANAFANKPQLTQPTGTALGVLTHVVGTDVGSTLIKSDLGTDLLGECSDAKLTGVINKNSEGSFEATIETALFAGTGAAVAGVGECTSTFGSFRVTANGNKVDGESIANGTPWCIRSTPLMAEDEFRIRGGGCTELERSITVVFDLTHFGSIIECQYIRKTPLKGTFTTDTASTQDAILSLEAGENTTFVKENSELLCPDSWTVQMAFTLELDAAMAAPIYMS